MIKNVIRRARQDHGFLSILQTETCVQLPFGNLFVWQPLTANFLHDTGTLALAHIGFNMLMLFMFGRELESRLGALDFTIFYLSAGIFAMLAQVTFSHLFGRDVQVVGASGSVMGLLMLFCLLDPQRRVQILFFPVAIPLWVIGALAIAYSFLGAGAGASSQGGNGPATAHVAHLGGLLGGVLYRYVDLTWNTIRHRHLARLFRRRSRARVDRAKIVAFPGLTPGELDTDPDLPPPPPLAEDDPETERISRRIDELLDKISRDGQDSLSAEELEFLQANSSRYKSQ